MTLRIDAHAHLWRLGRGDYGWLAGQGGPLAPLRRDFELSDLLAAAPGGGGRTLLVQAAPTVAETEHLLGLARAAGPAIAGVVGWVDLADPHAADEIGRLARDPLLKGVRPMLQDIAEPDWITTRPAPGCLDALTAEGLRLDALVTPRELPHLCRFVGARPDLPVMVDHAAKPQFSSLGTDGRWTAWRDGMRSLAATPHVCCKLSGLLTELPARMRRTPADAVEALRPMMLDLLDWFGPRRLAWGSDWPVSTLAGPPAAWREVTDMLLSGLAAGDRDEVMGGTAARFYGLDAGVTA